MKIRMLRQHGSYRVGEVVDLPPQQAERLMAWEYAAAVRDTQQELIETASVEPAAETADVTPRRRRK